MRHPLSLIGDEVPEASLVQPGDLPEEVFRELQDLEAGALAAFEFFLFSVESRFGIELPLPSISDSTTLASIAAVIVARIQDVGRASDGADADHETEVDLARRHVTDDVTLDDLAEIGEAVRSPRAEVGRII